MAHTSTSLALFATLRICRSEIPHVYGGQNHMAIQEDPATGSGIIVADIETTPESERYANLFAASPDLLKACKAILAFAVSDQVPLKQTRKLKKILCPAISKAESR